MFFGKFPKNAAYAKMKATQKLDNLALEHLSAYRVIASFAQESNFVNKYVKAAQQVKKVAADSNLKSAMVFGIYRSAIFGFFLYSFYVATYFMQRKVVNPITNEAYAVEEIVAVNIAMIIAFM